MRQIRLRNANLTNLPSRQRRLLTQLVRKTGIPSSPDDYISANPFDKGLAAAVVPDYPQNFDSAQRIESRKLKIALIHWMWMGYGFVYYDKTVLSNAIILDLADDLSLNVVDTVTSSAATVTT